MRHHASCLTWASVRRLRGGGAQIRDGTRDFGWGCIVSFNKRLPSVKQDETAAAAAAAGGPDSTGAPRYVLDVLLHCAKSETGPEPNTVPEPVASGQRGELVVH